MPFSTYLPEEMGAATLTPSGPFEAGSFQELVIVYTAGLFGIDDTGMLKIAWRTTSDMGKPQFDKPSAPSQGAQRELEALEHAIDGLEIELRGQIEHGEILVVKRRR